VQIGAARLNSGGYEVGGREAVTSRVFQIILEALQRRLQRESLADVAVGPSPLVLNSPALS
jgi:hypothetical protein